jgi:hypothetical protein
LMRCVSCGRELEAQSRFCDACGASQPIKARVHISSRTPSAFVPKSVIVGLIIGLAVGLLVFFPLGGRYAGQQAALVTERFTETTSVTISPTFTGRHVPKTVTSHGGASIDTSPSVFGGASGKFVASSSQYVSLADSADWYFGTGDFTIDFWVRFNSLQTNSTIMLYSQVVGSTHRIYIILKTDYPRAGQQQFRFYSNDGTNVVGEFWWQCSPNLATATWYHIALVRSGRSFWLFQGGTSLGTKTSSLSTADVASALTLGRYTTGGFTSLDGWLDEFRVSKGVARWTSNFTPPTAAYTPDQYTVLLLHMDGSNGSTTFADSE